MKLLFYASLLLLLFFVPALSQSLIDCEDTNLQCPDQLSHSYEKYCCATRDGGTIIFSCCNPYLSIGLGIGLSLPVIFGSVLTIVICLCCCAYRRNRKTPVRYIYDADESNKDEAGAGGNGSSSSSTPPPYSVGMTTRPPPYTAELQGAENGTTGSEQQVVEAEPPSSDTDQLLN